MEDNEKEKLQTRREFFRNAAKAVLPIIGALALSGIPRVVKAAESPATDCVYASCTTMCANNCSGYCRGECTNACNRGCSTYCNGGCSGTCRWSSRI